MRGYIVLPSDVIYEIEQGNPVKAGRALGELLLSQAPGGKMPCMDVFAEARTVTVSLIDDLQPVLTALRFNTAQTSIFRAAALKAFDAGKPRSA